MEDDKKNWKEVIKGLNLDSAGAPPWVSDFLKKAVSLGADAASSAGEKLGKTLNTVQFPVNISKDILREVFEGLIETYSIDLQAKIEFKRKETASKRDQTSRFDASRVPNTKPEKEHGDE